MEGNYRQPPAVGQTAPIVRLCKRPPILIRKSQFRTPFLGNSKNRNSGLPYPQNPRLPPLTLLSRLRRVCNRRVNLSPREERWRRFARRKGSEHLLFPTHFAKNAKWMGHGAFVKIPSGAKARFHFVAFAARLKSCPDTSCSPE